jgi:hypothetical protein
MRAPPPPDLFGSFDFSRAVTSLSLSRGALGFGDGDRRSWIPEVSSPPFSSVSLFLSLPFFSPARAPTAALARGPLWPRRGGLWPRRRGPPLLVPRGGPGPGDGPLRAVPAPGARPLCVAPALGGAARRGAAPCARPLAPLRLASQPPRRRDSLAPSRAAPRPPTRGPCPRQRGPQRGLALPRLPQRVPACAGPRAR